MSLADAAEFLAQAWPVFPTVGKVPLVKWRERATRDPSRVRAMFTPDATGIGVPMGADTGCFLVDLDGAAGLEWLAANRARLPATRQHRTPSGGIHLLFAWPSLRTIRNSVRKIAPGVDVRGEGGFAVFPPSPSYTIETDTMPAQAPAWLLDLIDPPVAPPAPREPFNGISVARKGRYAEVALDEECRSVASAPEGQRNHTLNVAAFSLGQLVAAGALEESVVREELRRAAAHAGLDPRETAATIESGLTAGKKQPREIPERGVGATTDTTHVAPSAPAPGSGQPLADGSRPKPVIWIDADPWDAKAIPKRPWLAPGYLLRGSVSVLSGQGAGGKSSLMVAWSIACAAGEAIGSFTPTEPLRVVNYNTEDDRHEQQRRYSAALSASKRDPDLMRHIVRCGPTEVGTLFERNPDTGRVAPTAAMEALEILCVSAGADLLICDPLAELHNAEENDNTAMRAVVAAFRGLAQRLNISVLVLHHDRKGNNAPGDMDRMRGASSLGGAVRVALTLTTMTSEEANKLGVLPEDRRRHFRIDGAKSNYAPPAEAEWWRISGYEIDNGEHVAAVMPWEPPTPFGGLSPSDCVAILHQMHRGTKLGHAYAATKQAGEDWAGRLLMDRHAKTDGQASAILSAWTANGLISVEELEGPRRGHPRKAYAVNMVAVSEMKAQFRGGEASE